MQIIALPYEQLPLTQTLSRIAHLAGSTSGSCHLLLQGQSSTVQRCLASSSCKPIDVSRLGLPQI